MYGSIFCRPTRNPRASSSAPMDADASPLPSEETTPPVTKMYFSAKSALPFLGTRQCSNIADLGLPVDEASVHTTVPQHLQHLAHLRAPGDAERDDIVAAQLGPHGPSLTHVPVDALAGDPRLAEMHQHQRDITRLVEHARHLATSAGRPHARPKPRRLVERAADAMQWLAAQAQPLRQCRGHRRALVARKRERRHRERRGEAMRARPREARVERGEAPTCRTPRTPARMEESEDPGAHGERQCGSR